MTPESDLADAYLGPLERALEDVVDFWYPRAVDDEYGGYRLAYDADGEPTGDGDKMVVTQARMVWFFARLARDGYGDAFADAAATGFDFLVSAMRDADNGGYYWEVRRDGTPSKENKHMYGQSFVLYALAEYHRATGDDEARRHAVDLFELFEAEAYDGDNGGYVEYFEPDWTPISAGGTYLDNIEPDWSAKKDLDASIDPTTKLMNTHLHLMEAFTTFYEATGHDGARRRLSELLIVNTNTVVRKKLGACTDKYAPDWRPLLDDEDFRIVSYGHDVENVWLTMAAAEALDVPLTYFRELYEALWAYTLEYGYDDEHGGLYFYGPFEEPATNRVKAWWVQAEALTSALRMYELIGDERYREVFEGTWDFLDEFGIDHDVGEWHSGVTEDLEPVGQKGAAYKGAYHNGRALLECIDALERLQHG